VPRDGLVAGADALAARIHNGDCFLTARPEMVSHYVFLHPELGNKVCAESPVQREVYAVINEYTRPQDLESVPQRLGGRYRLGRAVRVGRTEFDEYESTGGLSRLP
jgi:hypothetical protein